METVDDLDPLNFGSFMISDEEADAAIDELNSAPTILSSATVAEPATMKFPDGPWVGVDFDGTLARRMEGLAERCLCGPPIPSMVVRVKRWLAEGVNVRIFTARAARADALQQIAAMHQWCVRLGLPALPVTAMKDPDCIEIWDDRCVQVQTNTGVPMSTDPYRCSTRYIPGVV